MSGSRCVYGHCTSPATPGYATCGSCRVMLRASTEPGGYLDDLCEQVLREERNEPEPKARGPKPPKERYRRASHRTRRR